MIGAYLKKIFRRDVDVPANEQFYSPLRIAMHSTVDVDMIDWLTSLPELNASIVMPSGSLTVLAIGTTKVERDTLYDIYLIDAKRKEFSLQIMCAPNDQGKGLQVVETTIWQEVRTVVPLTESEWEDEMSDIGKNVIKFEGNEYKRLWASDHNGKVDMVQFDEVIIHASDTLNYTNNYMLYSRDLMSLQGSEPPKELLLTGVEETDETATIVMRLGLTIPESSVKVQ